MDEAPQRRLAAVTDTRNCRRFDNFDSALLGQEEGGQETERSQRTQGDVGWLPVARLMEDQSA